VPAPLRYAIQSTKTVRRPSPHGWHFVVSPAGDHVAFISGDDRRQRLLVDGQPVYPRRGYTTIQGEPAWANDSWAWPRSRRVPVADWSCWSSSTIPPATTPGRCRPRRRIRPARLLGRPGQAGGRPSLTKPVFAASFHRDAPPVVSLPPDGLMLIDRARIEEMVRQALINNGRGEGGDPTAAARRWIPPVACC